jgi:hypothetical protein
MGALRMIRMFFVCALLAFALPQYGQAQDQEAPEPEEYGEDEFSPFLRDLRRAEIVMLGSFPLTLFLSLEFYDLYRYADSKRDYRYAPWPFRAPDAIGYSQKENLGIFLSAVTASLLIATADYIIGRAKEKRREP